MSILSSIRAKMARARKNQLDEGSGSNVELLNEKLFHTTAAAPIYYLPIAKCGCTFVKNLLYRLEHGEDHPSGVHIHEDNDGLRRASKDELAQVQISPYCFTVLRDPVQRFTSLYFDKIIGTGPTSFPSVREHLLARGVITLAEDNDVEAHRENARRFIDWLELNLVGQTELGLNYHWRRQTSRLRRGRGFPVKCLTLDGLDWQLPRLVAPILPDIAEVMAAVKERNVSVTPFPPEDILDDALIGKIRTVYGQDWVNYEHARTAWAPLAPAMQPHAITDPGLIGHTRVCLPQAGPFTSVAGAYLSGAERVGGVISDRPHSELGQGDVIFMRDPMHRFVDAFLTIGSDQKMPNWRYSRLRRRAWKTGQWVFDPKTAEERTSALNTFLGAISALPNIFERHGLKPQYDTVKAALAAGFHPVATTDPVADSGVHSTAPPPSDMAEWLEALTPELAEKVRDLYRADFELYEELRAQSV